MNKKILIESITPLYNSYKDNKDKLLPVESLEIMWDIGGLLDKFIKTHNVKPHSLYREIYGKGEGSKNITQKSYITREFQGRCFRIRHMFPNKEQIRKELGRLRNFTAFREAMPFLDNPKYALKGEERGALIKLLNSNLKPSALLARIRALQAQKINRKNPRTQRLSDLEGIKQNFIDFYNYVYNLLKLKDYDSAFAKINNIPPEKIRELAKATACLCQEGLKSVKLVIPSGFDQLWLNYYNNINYLIGQKEPKERRRFRRIMPPYRIIRLADMLYALVDKKTYENFK